jgi:squalene-hopene/tetraprenyl-beta-curcumene cyclase
MASELADALVKTSNVLVSLRNAEGIWTGALSSSALSTATAVQALSLARQHGRAIDPRANECIQRGLSWLGSRANPDGGWGDTIHSTSNISTTTLVWAALTGYQRTASLCEAIVGAENWLSTHAGGLEPEKLAAKILQRYGPDRTFSAPILTHCALSGRLGEGRKAWRQVVPLPFELAACPQEWFGALRLPVVSYALPALIAIGYARHYHAPSGNPLSRLVRSLVTGRVLRILESIQPSNGGFLEAIPLTSFVAMSLAGSGKVEHPVTRRGVEFILNSAQPDGSWRIDTNLSTFVTTLATHALQTGTASPFGQNDRAAIQEWLLRQQYRTVHPYTNAAPGGWAWTPLPGGVPDADDTAGALLALKALEIPNQRTVEAAQQGIAWLLNLQNRDGGIPTFCRGWGKLPFDRSSADLTAHALRAWAAWDAELPAPVRARIKSARQRAVLFLRRVQEPGGSWFPLWFGNQFEPDEANRVYGTSRVLLALAETGLDAECATKAIHWLAKVQKSDGGWSGGPGPGPSSTEETALALEALCAAVETWPQVRTEFEGAIRRGLRNLLDRIEAGTWNEPAPIGFYFAKLWYYEKLYPVIFTVAALSRAARILG